MTLNTSSLFYTKNLPSQSILGCWNNEPFELCIACMRAYATNHDLLNSAKLQVPSLLKLRVPGTDMLLLMPPSSSVPRTLLSKIQEPVDWYILLLINQTLWKYLFTEVNYRYFVSVGYLKNLYNNKSQWSQTSRDDNWYGVLRVSAPLKICIAPITYSNQLEFVIQ